MRWDGGGGREGGVVHQEVQGGDEATEPEVGRGIPGHACKRPMTHHASIRKIIRLRIDQCSWLTMRMRRLGILLLVWFGLRFVKKVGRVLEEYFSCLIWELGFRIVYRIVAFVDRSHVSTTCIVGHSSEEKITKKFV